LKSRPFIILCALVALSSTGCRRDEKIKLEETDESTPTIASMVHAADPKASMQLTRGFHTVEQNSWRWTMGTFAITLRPPSGSADQGAKLTAKLSMPDAILQKLKQPTLTASIQKKTIGAHRFTAPGEFTFEADVPPDLLKNDAVTVEFSLEPHLPAGALDGRELGLVFVSAGFAPK
jgi:hypothetical protein